MKSVETICNRRNILEQKNQIEIRKRFFLDFVYSIVSQQTIKGKRNLTEFPEDILHKAVSRNPLTTLISSCYQSKGKASLVFGQNLKETSPQIASPELLLKAKNFLIKGAIETLAELMQKDETELTLKEKAILNNFETATIEGCFDGLTGLKDSLEKHFLSQRVEKVIKESTIDNVAPKKWGKIKILLSGLEEGYSLADMARKIKRSLADSATFVQRYELDEKGNVVHKSKSPKRRS